MKISKQFVQGGQQYVYLFLLLIGLGFSGWYYAQSSFIFNALSPKLIAYLPDIIVDDLSVKQFDIKGQLSHYFYTPQLIHTPNKNLSRFTHPKIILSSQEENGRPWSIQADNGIAEDGLDKITLINNVVFHQNASGNDQEKTLRTTSITYYPKKNWAETQEMIFFEEPRLHAQSLGMTANLKTQEIHLLQQVSSIYVPNKNN